MRDRVNLIEVITRYLNLLSEDRLREVYDYVRFLYFDDLMMARGIEILSQESLREFLENEPDIYSPDDVKESGR